MKISRSLVVAALVIAAASVGLAMRAVSSASHDLTATQVRLPESGRQRKLDEYTVLYASNEDLTDMLTRLDVHFKGQSLNSDANSPDFKAVTGSAGREGISNCVEFKYFRQQDNTLASQFTLLPERAECFSKDPTVIKEVQELCAKYKYVYAARTF